MRLMKEGKWKTIFLLSIIVPMGLLVAFKYTHITDYAAPIEVVLDPAIWSSLRPNQSVKFNQLIERNYTENDFVLKYTVLIGEYIDNSISRNGDDFVELRVTVKSVGHQGIQIKDIQLEFSKDVQPSLIYWYRNYIGCENASMSSISDGYTTGSSYRQAMVHVDGANSSSDVSFGASIEWSFPPTSETHQVQLLIKTDYFNETYYKRIIGFFTLELDTAA